MRYRIILPIVAVMMSSVAVKADVVSPGGRIVVSTDGGGIVVSATTDTRPVDVITIAGDVADVIADPVVHTDSYTALTGKRRECSNSYSQARYVMADGDTITMRVYTDGVAWRAGSGVSVVDVSPARHSWLQSWVDCYEGFYPRDRDTKAGERYGYPALMEYDGGVFGLLTESGLDRTSAGSSIYATSGKGIYELKPDGPGTAGWATMIIGSLSDVVESTLVADNSAPCVLTDTSWICPGVASWIYWAYNHGSNDYDIIKRYVDMAVELRLPYVLIDAEWDEMKDGKTVEDAVAYAIGKGIKPMIWYNSSIGWINGAPGPKFRLNDPADREREFAWCERIGVAGVKIDFFSGDDNRNISYMHDLMEDAARHKLLVNFHGATLPRGWQRTYPNLVTTEAVYGAEWYNNVPTFTSKAAAHNATLPFTRNVVGSMDYTPCAFSDSQHPHITTHAHELALTVLFESGVQHLADRPESLLSQPDEVKRFFSELPASWDDTVLLAGYPGEYAVMARRKGDTWYIAGINGTDADMADVSIDFSRLGISGADMRLYADGATTGSWDISRPKSLPGSVAMKARGGFVLVARDNN